MRPTPSSTARRRTLRALSRSGGQPQMPSPVIRIAPKPSRLTERSSPNRKRELVPASAGAGGFAAKIMFDLPASSVAPPARVVPSKFLFHVVVAVGRHPLKGEVFHFAISAGHFHASGMIADNIAAIHDGLVSNATLGNGRFLAGFHHFHGSAPGASEISEKLMIVVELGQLHHLLHHLGLIW